MNESLRNQANVIVREAIAAVLPDTAVRRALSEITFRGRVLLVAVGKAAWRMAKAASDELGPRIEKGVVVTKYGHVQGPIESVRCFEAGHPVPDENSFRGTEEAIGLVRGLSPDDTVLFLLSGGGSALFEKPLIPAEELADITNRLLSSGADITEINTVRKKLSAVKGGRFAKICSPAKVETVILSDILGDPVDMIASGPACPDPTTGSDALRVVEKYGIRLSEEARKLLDIETPKTLDNVRTRITGSVRELCRAAAESCEKLGYRPVLLTDQLSCRARDAGSFLASVVKTHAGKGEPLAFLAGGETVVEVTGNGKGGRNQEIALAAAKGIAGMKDACVFSFGSDGTDGPTDAAGGYADGDTENELLSVGIRIDDVLRENDSYHALQKIDGLIMTGPTGTNVNDVSIALIRN